MDNMKYYCEYECCGEEYDPEESDAREQESFCSMHCECSLELDNLPF